MKKIILLSSLLCSFAAIAQDYQWQWAKSGGGTMKTLNETNNAYWHTAEQIYDIKVDANNNHYYLASISQGNTQIDGHPITTYNISSGNNDILIASFDCEGIYRWSRVIGGTLQDYAYTIELDSENGVYVAPIVYNNAIAGSQNIPTQFSEDNSLPYLTSDTSEAQEGYKTGFLLKYDAEDGDLIWRKDLQGNVKLTNRFMHSVGGLQIDSSNTIHMILGFQSGIHLDGLITIPESIPETLTYYLVKFNTQGNVIGTPTILPFEGSFIEHQVKFRYDEPLNRYYFTGWRSNPGNSSTLRDLSYNNIPFTKNAYVLAINGSNGAELWRKEISTISDFTKDNARIYGIEIDNNSDIYIGGRIINTGANPGASFGDHTFSNSVTGNVPFILKMNSSGTVQWSKVPDGYTNSIGQTGIYFAYQVAINSSEVALATHSVYHIWGDYQMQRPENHITDPVLVRFNKQTGDVVGMHDIMGIAGVDDAFTAVTVDNDGNYVTGGYFRYNLFSDNDNGVPTITKAPGYTDFFMAKLAASVCGETVSNEEFSKSAIKLYPNPTSNRIFIESEESFRNYEIYNILGQNVAKGTFENNENSISLEGLSNGTYVIKLQTTQGTVFTEKVVKN